jgi:hypothetical protein
MQVQAAQTVRKKKFGMHNKTLLGSPSDADDDDVCTLDLWSSYDRTWFSGPDKQEILNPSLYSHWWERV